MGVGAVGRHGVATVELPPGELIAGQSGSRKEHGAHGEGERRLMERLLGAEMAVGTERKITEDILVKELRRGGEVV